MSPSDDYPDEMPALPQLDDLAAEALLSGQSVASELEPVAVVVRALRETAGKPVPPSAALAAQMAAGVFTGPPEQYRAPAHRPQGRGLGVAARRWVRTGVRKLAAAPRKVAAMSLAGKAGTVALTVGLVGVGSAGFAGALPEPVQGRFQTVVESVTPYEFPSQVGQDSELEGGDRDGVTNDGGDSPEVDEEVGNQGERGRPTDLPAPATEAPGGPPDEHPGQGQGPGSGNAPGRPTMPGPPDNPGPPEDRGPPDNPGRPGQNPNTG